MKGSSIARSLVHSSAFVLLIAGLWFLAIWPLPAAPPLLETSKQPQVPESPAPTPIVAIRGMPLQSEEEPLPAGAEVRIGSTRFRHPTEIASGVVMADHFLVTTHYSTLTVTDAQTGRRLAVQDSGFETSSANELRCMASPDGRALVVCDCTAAKLWKWQDDAKGPLQFVVDLPFIEPEIFNLPNALSFAADSRELYLIRQRDLFVFAARTGKLRQRLVTDNPVAHIASSAKRFVTVTLENTRKQRLEFGGFYLSGKSPTYRFKPKMNKVPVAKREPRGEPDRLVGMIEVNVHDMETGRRIASILAPRARNDSAFPFESGLGPILSPNGKYLSCDCRGERLVWHVDSGRRVLHIEAIFGKDGEEQAIDRSGFSSDNRRFWVSSSDGTKRFYDLRTGQPVEFIENVPGEEPQSARLMEPKLGVMQYRHEKGGIKLPLPPGYAGIVFDVSRDGKLIAVADRTGRIDLWESDGRLVRTLSPSGPKVFCVVFSPDGSRLAASDEGRRLRIWSSHDWGSPELVEVPSEHDELYPEQLTFTPDGCRMLINKDRIMTVWDLAAHAWIWDTGGDFTRGKTQLPLVFAASGRRVVLGYFGNLTWLDAGSGEQKNAIYFPCPHDPGRWSDFTAMSIAPDERTLAIIFDQTNICILKSGNGAFVRAFRNEAKIPFRESVLQYSADGRRLATCDYRGRAYIWDVMTGELAHVLECPDGEIHDLRFGSDSRTLITSNHREVIVWRLKPKCEPLAIPDRWDQLGHFAAEQAESARWQFLEDPLATVTFLKATLPPRLIEVDEMRQLLDALDAPTYRERERAARQLRSFGRLALPYLNSAPLTLSPEVRRRIETIRRDIATGPSDIERQHARAVEILEILGTKEAWELIAKCGQADQGSVLAEEAEKALARHRESKSASRGGE